MSRCNEFILGGQKSGKSRRAEQLAQDWLAQSNEHRALLIATAQPWDEEMRARIERHQSDRALRLPGIQTIEEPRDVAAALESKRGLPRSIPLLALTTLSGLSASTTPANAPPAPKSARE